MSMLKLSPHCTHIDSPVSFPAAQLSQSGCDSDDRSLPVIEIKDKNYLMLSLKNMRSKGKVAFKTINPHLVHQRKFFEDYVYLDGML
jgi:hypothetical protein